VFIFEEVGVLAETARFVGVAPPPAPPAVLGLAPEAFGVLITGGADCLPQEATVSEELIEALSIS